MTREMIGIHITHCNRMRPEFIPAGEKAGLVVEVYLDDEYGAIAEVYPWGRMSEQMWDKRHREFSKLSDKEQNKIIQKQKEVWNDKKPVDTSKWIYPRKSDIKEQIATHLFYAYLTTDKSERTKYIGRMEAMQWIIYYHMPPSRKHIGWMNISSIGSFDGNEVKSLEGIIDMLGGKAMTTSKSISEKFAVMKDKKKKLSDIQINSHEDFLAHAKRLEKAMITVKTKVIDD